MCVCDCESVCCSVADSRVKRGQYDSAICCSVSQCVAVCCNMLQSVAECCSALQSELTGDGSLLIDALPVHGTHTHTHTCTHIPRAIGRQYHPTHTSYTCTHKPTPHTHTKRTYVAQTQSCAHIQPQTHRHRRTDTHIHVHTHMHTRAQTPTHPYINTPTHTQTY